MTGRATTRNEKEKRQAIIDVCRRINALGINQGTSGAAVRTKSNGGG
jgi:hypothetical protein